MAKHEFTKENQPKNRRARGKAERTKLIEAMKRAGETEESFYDQLITRAFNPEDSFAAKEVLTRLYPIPKATMPTSEWNFPADGTALDKANSILIAISKGEIAPDVGHSLISALTSLIKIQEVTELEDRIKALEDSCDE